MTESITSTLPLQRWPKEGQGDRGTYHLVNLKGEAAEAITTHAALHRMEFGKQRGFGSVKVMARIGETEWKTSVFPMNIEDMSRRSKSWSLLVSKKVMKAQDIVAGDMIKVSVTPI